MADMENCKRSFRDTSNAIFMTRATLYMHPEQPALFVCFNCSVVSVCETAKPDGYIVYMSGF